MSVLSTVFTSDVRGHLARRRPPVRVPARARLAPFLAIGLVAVLGAGPVSAANFLVAKAQPIGTVGSTVPGNGDVNPYGVAVVPRSVGRLVKGDVLVSNFNGKSNLQGTGTTIVQISPSGARSLFAAVTPASVAGRCPAASDSRRRWWRSRVAG